MSIRIRHFGEVVMAYAQVSPHEIGERYTTLMRAALEGRTETVKALLRTGVDVDARDHEGHTALMFAAINMHAATVKALLDCGADVNARARDGGTALMPTLTREPVTAAQP
jgi:ankyrin repeat protein